MKETLQIQWYPGHMTKTRRQMEADLKLVDAVCEILDARIPWSSRNPDIAAICGNKPRLIILNRTDLADPVQTQRWCEYFRAQGLAAVATDCKSRRGVAAFQPAVRALLAEKSGEGKTKEVKALLNKYDAGKLSGVKPEDYPALMEEARSL